MNWKLALTGLMALPGTSLFAGAQTCPDKPIPIRDIKFHDIDGDNLHNYELRGNAYIKDDAPGGIPRALRIDQLHSYALLKGVDISPASMPEVTMAIGVYIESIKPAPAGAPVPGQVDSYGWVMSHDNGGYDRAIFLHDERFGGAGMSAGYIPDAEPPQVPLQEWIQVVAVWRQGGECSLFIDNEKVDFPETVIGRNGPGLPDVAIGAPQLRTYQKSNDNDFWIKDVKIFDYALSDEEVDNLNCNFVETLEPTLDCGQGGDLVYSCTECVSGDGSASGCAGDCMWRPEIPHCVEKNDSSENTVDDVVSCGDHDAADCSQCGVSEDGSTGCAGDCIFGADGICEPRPVCATTFTNVAYSRNGGRASQINNYEYGPGAASLANDGKSNVCTYDHTHKTSTMSHTHTQARNPWWKVNFRKSVINKVQIYNRCDSTASHRLVGHIMEIFDGSTVVYSSKVSNPEESSTDKRIYTFDIPSVTGDMVRIRKENWTGSLHLVEVVVNGCTPMPVCTSESAINVAYSRNGGRASQINNYEYGPGAASLANDGKSNVCTYDHTHKTSTMSHTHTQARNPWWKVNFRKSVINKVQIYNRCDSTASHRLVGHIMEIFNGSTVVYSSKVSNPEESSTDKRIYTFDIPPSIVGNAVRIRKENWTGALHLVEVVVNGCKV